MAMDKKAVSKAKKDFALHTLLVQREEPSRAVAQAIAYAEGAAGLETRLKGGPRLVEKSG